MVVWKPSNIIKSNDSYYQSNRWCDLAQRLLDEGEHCYQN
jgi:hypothetical protein